MRESSNRGTRANLRVRQSLHEIVHIKGVGRGDGLSVRGGVPAQKQIQRVHAGDYRLFGGTFVQLP